MKIEPIVQTSFKCHKQSIEKIRDYGKVIQDTGIFKGNKLNIYSAYDTEGKLVHKLYYLSDSVGHWIKSKLKYYSGGKCYKTVWGFKDNAKND